MCVAGGRVWQGACMAGVSVAPDSFTVCNKHAKAFIVR